jgi:HEPN domain-containing protein
MTIKEHIEYWLNSAEDDLVSAQINFESKRYNWSLFIAHLALEKLIKSLFIQNTQNPIPPKTHNLLKLAELSGISLTNEQTRFYFVVNDFQISTRYPDYKNEIYRIATEEYTKDVLQKINKEYQWLKSLIKQ